PQLKHHYPELGETLQARRLSVELRFAEFQQYDRIALAEAVLEQDERGFRPSTYLAFQHRYVEGASGEASWLERARTAVGGLGEDSNLSRLVTGLGAAWPTARPCSYSVVLRLKK
ncbi:MAG TPA: hypothetical protein VJ735_20815, partial [Actinomycetes bacterium]|nr:hypothetical protein [Actinomycetes bacterium]